jgi:ABC-type sugar transport system substrate-binding protein
VINDMGEAMMRRKVWFGLVAGLGLLAGLGCGGATTPQRFRMGMMPKITGIAYFNACERGAREAAAELDIDLHYDGPATNDIEEQIRMLDQWITEDYDCIAVAPNQPARISPVLKRARAKGIIVLTFDADANEGRQFFINQATYDSIAEALVDTMAEETDGEGPIAILTSTLDAPNQSEWARRMKAYQAKKHPRMALLPETPTQENSKIGIDAAKNLIQANRDLKGFIGLTSIAFPAAAEAVEQQGQVGTIHVVGLSTPKEMVKYVKDGTVKTVILWKPVDLGYLTVYVADLVRKNEMKVGGTLPEVGRLKNIQVRDGHEVILGPPMKFTAANIDEYDF